MEATSELPTLLTIPQTCRLANMSRTSLYREIGAGRLPTRKFGRLTRIHRNDFEAWASGEVDPAPKRRRRA